MKKVLLVFGTRPEAIKMAPLILELQKYQYCIQTLVCVTGQHRGMLDQVLSLFDIKPDYDLDIMQQGQDLFDVTTRIMQGMRQILRENPVDLVLVHGDTTTSLAAALSSFYLQIPVAHVEAGLRTYNKCSPWPEEVNRQLTSRIATLHFSPTQRAKTHLLSEHVAEESIFVTGNSVIDALHYVIAKISDDKSLNDSLCRSLSDVGYNMRRIENEGKRMVLITAHRRENFGDGFFNICNALKMLAYKYPHVDLVFPVHPNPNVRKSVHAVLGSSAFHNLFFLDPLDYLSFIYLMGKSYIVLTDSGGIQEEAPSLGKPVLVMRDTTERPEAVMAGTVKLIGTNCQDILNEVSLLLDSKDHFLKMSTAVNPYGDGKCCARIIKAICSFLDIS